MASILVVDDSSVDRALITGLLKQVCPGTHVVPVDNCWEALELLQIHPFDLVITDFMMPEIDGIQLIQEIGVRGFDLPVILLTSFDDEEIAVRAIRAGAANYIPKRLIARFLKPVVDDLLSTAQSRTRLLSFLSDYQNRFVIENDISLIESVVAHIQDRIVTATEENDKSTSVSLDEQAWLRR